MEIIETVTAFGKTDIFLTLGMTIVGVIMVLVAKFKFENVQMGLLGLSVVLVGLIGLVFTLTKPEQTYYRAVVTDYSVVQEEGYTIEKKENKETYILRKIE